MKIPFSPPYIDDSVINEVTDSLRSGWITTGPKVKALEEEIRKLTVSVERLTITLSNVVKEQDSQEKRLDLIEQKDGEMWRTFVKYVITAVVGVVVGFVMRNVGF